MAELKRYWLKNASGALALNFCNTVDERPRYLAGDYSATGEHLVSGAALYEWLYAQDRSKALAKRYEAKLKGNAAALREQLIDLRELLFATFIAIIRKGRVSAKTTGALNCWLKQLPPKILEEEKSGSLRLVREEGGPLETFSALFLDSATELLVTEKVGRVKVCAAPECGWLFLDESKNGSKRWCEMGDCGNRAKARKFYQRRKGNPSS